MPIHDWTRVNSGTFHDLHTVWIGLLRNRLNEQLLPAHYYAMAEQRTGPLAADVLTLERTSAASNGAIPADESGVALLEAPPKVRITEMLDIDWYAAKQNVLVIHHVSEDRIVALIEILSSGNKSSRRALDDFLEKAAAALKQNINLLLIDLYPPGPHDPDGIHGALRSEYASEDRPEPFHPPAGKLLTIASYDASNSKAYIEPLAVGDGLPVMPLFLEPGRYVNVPLEETYAAAFKGVPRHLKQTLER